MIGIVYDDLFLEHGEPWHPENRQRLEITMSHLREAGWLERLVSLEFGPATLEQVAWLHDEDYVRTVAEMSELGGGAFDADTTATSYTYAAAMLAAGGAMTAARAAISDVPARSICLLRPPGHHALADRAMGFCFFNNAALAAGAALREGARRVAIVDFDVHHGNGTQDAFYHRRDVLYVSLHETPLYPGTGTLDEVGVEDGAGFNINIPMYGGACDRHYERAFAEVIVPALDEFRPELVVTSAGYDGHHQDGLARTNLSINAYHQMTQLLVGVAEGNAEGRIVVVLEGGYNTEWLPRGIENTIRALAGEPRLHIPDEAADPHPRLLAQLDEALDTVIATHRQRLGL